MRVSHARVKREAGWLPPRTLLGTMCVATVCRGPSRCTMFQFYNVLDRHQTLEAADGEARIKHYFVKSEKVPNKMEQRGFRIEPDLSSHYFQAALTLNPESVREVPSLIRTEENLGHEDLRLVPWLRLMENWGVSPGHLPAMLDALHDIAKRGPLRVEHVIESLQHFGRLGAPSVSGSVKGSHKAIPDSWQEALREAIDLNQSGTIRVCKARRPLQAPSPIDLLEIRTTIRY